MRTWCCIATGTPTILSTYWVYGNFKVFCTSESRAPALHHDGHVHNLIHERITQRSSRFTGWWELPQHSVEDLNSLRDFLNSQHLSLCCRLHSWSVHHSVELPEPESEASAMFTVGLGLAGHVRVSTVSSVSFSVSWTSGTCAVF